VLLKIGFQGLAGHRLDHLAGKVDADAVFPTRPRIEQQRHAQRTVLVTQDAGKSDDLDVAAKIGVEDVVTLAGRVRPASAVV
jgi:hypothetical protein